MALDNLIVASGNEQTPVNSGSVFLVGGTIRNTGAGFFWINNSQHTPVNIDIATIVTSATEVTIKYKQAATKVISLVVVPDETYAQQNIFVGASVDLDVARIFFYDKLGVLIDPTTLTSALGNFWILGMFLK